jgi:hypothetical protein
MLRHSVDVRWARLVKTRPTIAAAKFRPGVALVAGLLLSCSLASPSHAQDVAPAPEPAPRAFTTNTYELTTLIPPGLYHCPHPKGSMGSDHGLEIYLVRPRACDPTAPVAADAEVLRLPRVQIFYANNGDGLDPPRTVDPPRTNEEWRPKTCPPPAAKLPVPPRLLGLDAIECVQRTGDAISVAIGTLYDHSPGAERGPPGTPDSAVWLQLDTTIGRYSLDLEVLRALAAQLRICVAADRPAQPSRPRCPPFTQW